MGEGTKNWLRPETSIRKGSNTTMLVPKLCVVIFQAVLGRAITGVCLVDIARQVNYSAKDNWARDKAKNTGHQLLNPQGKGPLALWNTSVAELRILMRQSFKQFLLIKPYILNKLLTMGGGGILHNRELKMPGQRCGFEQKKTVKLIKVA